MLKFNIQRKQSIRNITVDFIKIIFISIFCYNSCPGIMASSSVVSSTDAKIVTFTKKAALSPFSMPSIAVSCFGYKYHKFQDQFLKETDDLEIVISDNKKANIWGFAIQLDRPVFEKYLSFGYTFGSGMKFLSKSASESSTAKTKAIADGKRFVEEKDSFLVPIYYSSVNVRLRLPLPHSNAGDIAFTTAAHAGFATIVIGGVAGYEIKPRLAFHYALSGGLEYYPTKWIGVFGEFELQFYKFTSGNYKTKISEFESAIENKKTAFKEHPERNYLARDIEQLEKYLAKQKTVNKGFSFNTGWQLRFGIKITF